MSTQLDIFDVSSPSHTTNGSLFSFSDQHEHVFLNLYPTPVFLYFQYACIVCFWSQSGPFQHVLIVEYKDR